MNELKKKKRIIKARPSIIKETRAWMIINKQNDKRPQQQQQKQQQQKYNNKNQNSKKNNKEKNSPQIKKPVPQKTWPIL